MSDAERFDAVLTELGHLLVDLKLTGVDVVLIGGQVISVEALTAGRKAVIAVETPTGVAVQRGYSMEPDLLFDVEDAGARGEAIAEVLKSSGFSRVRDFRWGKRLAAGDMLVDLFVSSDVDDAQNPGGFARLPRGDLALSRAGAVHPVVAGARLDIKIPDPVGFLSMKIEAKDRLRPTETKDSFDIYAYVSLKGAKKVGDALRSSSECAAILGALRRFFAEVDAPGVRDVVSFAGSLEEAERDLLARAVVDLFDELHRIAGG